MEVDNNDNSELSQLISDDEDEERTYEPSKVLEQKPSSIVWTFFVFKGSKKNGLDKSQVFCSLCLTASESDESGKKKPVKPIKYQTTTSSMLYHLEKFHKEALEAAKKEESKSKSSKNVPGNLITSYATSSKVVKWPKGSHKWKDATEKLAKWMVKEIRPMAIVKDEGFIEFTSSICPQYEVPCSNTVGRNIEDLYFDKKQELIKELKNVKWLAITTDGGSSTNAVSFIDVNVHYVSESWELKSVTLGVRQNKEEHTAKKYRQIVDDLLEEFGIDKSKVCCYEVVSDVIKKLRKVTTFHNKSPKF